jgi:hypothetical protein
VAFRRLVVTRSAPVVWLGALCFAGWLALESSVTRGGFATRPFYIYGYILFGLVTVRGLVGAWFGELRVDRTARTIKTCTGEVVDFDRIGGLTVAHRELLAEGVKDPLYRGETAAIQERHDALAAVLGRGRLQLLALRRLAHHTIVPLALLGIGGIVAVIATTYEFIVLDGVHELEYKLIELGALAVSLGMLHYAVFGSKSERQLRVDPIAGVLQLEDGKHMRFDELGDVTLAVKNNAGYPELRAANVERALYWSHRLTHVELRLAALQTALLQHALRRALEAPVIEGDAFRSVDVKADVARIVGDSPHRAAALKALAHDPDTTIADRARGLQ